MTRSSRCRDIRHRWYDPVGRLLAAAVLVGGCAGPTPEAPSPEQTVRARPITAPPSEAGATAALASSPRRGEWVEVERPNGMGPITTWIVRPEIDEAEAAAPVVLVIHEIFGLTDWVRAVADQLAANGFVAVAPDLLSGLGPGGGGTPAVASRDEVVRLIRALEPEDVVDRLEAVRAYASTLRETNGAVAALGFCWGGSASFAYAVAAAELRAAVVFYGSSPVETADYHLVETPVLGLYAGDDERVTVTVPIAEREMARFGKHYEFEIFDGAGHGFVRAQDDRQGANRAATERAWPRAVEFLRRHLF